MGGLIGTILNIVRMGHQPKIPEFLMKYKTKAFETFLKNPIQENFSFQNITNETLSEVDETLKLKLSSLKFSIFHWKHLRLGKG